MNNLIRLSPAHVTTDAIEKPVVEAKPRLAVAINSPIVIFHYPCSSNARPSLASSRTAPCNVPKEPIEKPDGHVDEKRGGEREGYGLKDFKAYHFTRIMSNIERNTTAIIPKIPARSTKKIAKYTQIDTMVIPNADNAHTVAVSMVILSWLYAPNYLAR